MVNYSGVCLTPFLKSNISLTYKWIKDPDLRHMFLMRGEPTWNGHQSYFKRVLADDTQKIFAINFEGTHIGNCGLKNINVMNKEAELWIYIGEPSMRGQGISKDVMLLLLQTGFEILGLDLIYLHVAEFNTTARNLYEQLGFIEVPLSNSSEWRNRGVTILRMEIKSKNLGASIELAQRKITNLTLSFSSIASMQ